MDEYTVGELARLAHVSVRTLHHYDAIGLLTPSGRTTAGYRVYRAPDLTRLRQILFYRRLEFGLDEIAQMLADPGATVDNHLRKQHQLLRERIEQHRDLLAALEKEMEARKMGISLTPEEQFEVFGTDQVGGEWADEARDRWSDTDAYQESQQCLTRWFYDCDYDLHRNLAEMYVADERFAATFDTVAPGLAQWVHDAILTNADRLSG